MTGVAAIENAILDRFRAFQPALGYTFRTLESYPEDFDTYLKEKVIGDRAFPAAWVVFGGWRQPREETTSLQAEAVFMVVLAAQNMRNEKAQRHGATAKEVGSYQLMMDAAALLHGQHLGLDIGRLQLGPCRSIRPDQTIKERQLSLYALEFTTVLPIELGRFVTAELTDFATFNANWDLPPFAALPADEETGARLPADAQVEATDTLQVPQ